MTTTDEGLSYRHAAERIAKCVRTVERLVKAGKLKNVGVGQNRKVTIASIESYLEADRERFCDIDRDMSESVSRSSGYERTMDKLLRTVPPLSTPQSAARRLGIPPADVQRLVKHGHIPSIQIGPSEFIPGGWLAPILAKAYASGRKGNE